MRRARALKLIHICDELVDLGGGRFYACGRHTKDKKTRKCTLHRPQPARQQQQQAVR